MKLVVICALAASQGHFETPKALEKMQKHAYLETTMGEIVPDLLPEKAPNHVGYFIKMVEEDAYDHTSFHRVIKYGIIQGGDPKTKYPDARQDYGTGGLGLLARELNDEKHAAAAGSAVQIPGQPDSAGAQFFVVVTEQASLNGQYTVFARVVEGMRVVQKISDIPADKNGKTLERVEILDITLRDHPPPEIPPFSTESVEEIATYRAVLESSLGDITLELFPDRAPNHVRKFLRLAEIGAYDGVSFHRIVPGFVIQTGWLDTRSKPVLDRAMKYVTSLEPEFNATLHVPGIVSMAHGDDPASADTSFFIVTGIASSLDNNYTVFGHVVDGMNVVHTIEAVPIDGETPLARVALRRVRIERIP
jgi:peptidyl-prolyl cis-trans isomerase B (cyclophilin B)